MNKKAVLRYFKDFGTISQMKPKVYLETTIISYLTARPSRDLILAAHQQITNEWWKQQRGKFEVFGSQIVIQEAGGGDPDAAQRRLDILQEIPLLDVSDSAKLLAKQLMQEVPLPERARVDALHIAVSVVNGMDYLLTWNCTHIANAPFRHRIETICRENKTEPPVICTPEELLED